MKSILSDKLVCSAFLTLVMFLGGAGTTQAADANLNMIFTTTNAGGSYGDRHVHVVWIKDAGGNFVYTAGSTTTDNKRALWANSRASSLKEWWDSNAANRTADVAARTGATQTAYRTYNLNWNWRKKDGTIVPDGTYQIHFLCTNSDSGTPRNKTSFNITKGASAWAVGPVTQGGYTNISLTFTPAGLGVLATAATNVTSNAATLNGQVTSTGGTNPNVSIYWGDNDGGTVAGNWDHQINLGTQGLGAFSADVTGLIQGTTYYYTCYAVNGGGSAWSASSQSFSANSLNTLFAEGDIWKYFKGLTFPGTTWNTKGFNDAGWLSGPTGIGYDDGDDATVLNDMMGSYWTVYMRKIIVVDVPANVTAMTFKVDYDDGFVAFINGTEVARRGVDSGQNQNTPATSHDAGTPENIDITAFKTVLTPGENVFAIEVHNATLSSTDLSMIPEMTIAGGISEPAGRIGLSSVMLDFGTVALGNSHELVLNITNTGNAALQVTSLQPVGLDSEVYSIVPLPTLPFILPPAGTESIMVRFHPLSVQDYRYSRLAVGSDDPGKIAYVDLVGAGGPNTALATRPVGGIGGPAKALAKYGDNVLLGQGAMLVLLDVSTPAVPVKINQIRLEGVIQAITVQGDVAYAALGNKGFAAVDLKDFTPLLGVATFETGGFASDIDSEGNLLCVADGIAGSHLYNISTPLEPVFVHTYETIGAANAVDVSGTLLYVLDESQGLQVFQATPTIPSGAIVGRWKLDDGSGTVAADSSPNGYHGTLVNMDNSNWVTGITGSALGFDGANDYAEITGYKGITGTASRTCCAWIKTNGSAANMVILDWGAIVSGQQWLFGIFSTGKLTVYAGGPYIQTNAVVTDGQWHHVAAVMTDDGSPSINEINLYIDGVLQSVTYSGTNAINTVSGPNVIVGSFEYAAGQKGFYFPGLMDDLRIYDYALTADEIQSLQPANGYPGVEFGTQAVATPTSVYAVDAFGNLVVLDAAGETVLSETILQVGSAKDIQVQNGYAYVTGETGLEVLNVSNPASPGSVAVYSGVAKPEAIVLDPATAYVADGEAGLAILDIANPAAISLLGTYSLRSASGGVSSPASLEDVYVVGNGQNLTNYDVSASADPVSKAIYGGILDQAEDIAVEGQYAFVAAGLSGMKVFDLSNPASTPAVFATDGFAAAVSVKGSKAIVTDGTKVYVVDVSTPMAPSLVGSWTANGRAFDVAVTHTHGYVAEGNAGIAILELSNVLPVGSYPVDGVAYGLAIDADVLYVASGTAGLTVLNVSAPASPSLIANYDLPGVIVDAAKVGNRLCVADVLFGVSVLDVSNPAMPTLYASAATSAPAFHLSVAGSRILAADTKGGLAVVGVTEWPKVFLGNIAGGSQIDLEDLGVLAGQWLSSETELGSLAGNIDYYDTLVNLKDFSVLAARWLEGI